MSQLSNHAGQILAICGKRQSTLVIPVKKIVLHHVLEDGGFTPDDVGEVLSNGMYHLKVKTLRISGANGWLRP